MFDRKEKGKEKGSDAIMSATYNKNSKRTTERIENERKRDESKYMKYKYNVVWGIKHKLVL